MESQLICLKAVGAKKTMDRWASGRVLDGLGYAKITLRYAECPPLTQYLLMGFQLSQDFKGSRSNKSNEVAGNYYTF